MNEPRPATRRPTVDPESVFFREGGRNRFTARRAHVVDVSQVSPVLMRVRVTGPEFDDYYSGGPGDHSRLYFPDPDTGELNAPTPVGPGEDGIVRPDGAAHARDFTPLPVSDYPDGVAVDFDFFLHDSPGPASRWAQQARVGDELVVVGPRGSKQAPQRVSQVVLICDETSLPSVTRWVAEVPASTSAQVIAVMHDDGAWVSEYLAEASGRSDATITILRPDDDLIAAVPAIDSTTFVFAAGEASSLVPLRRHLRRERGLPAEQVALSGYWRQGEVAFDHHSPVDPSDPD